MPYEPLHHKYRPQTFAQLVGQAAIATTLSNALQQNRIAPAYLFSGPRGTGKTSSARILAKSLNCLNSPQPTPEPCGTCEVCRAIANGSALDVIEIDAASNTGVDNIRELIERAQFAPVQCRHKVYVVDECHMLSTAAFNALLKTLEEPPAHVVFVLATTDPQRVLPTIISRCQRFDFRRIPLAALIEHLSWIAAQEKIAIADEAIRLVAQMAQGGLRDAESLLDQLSLLAGQVTVERVWDLVGAVPEQDLLALVQAIAADQAATVLEQTRQLLDRGREPLVVLQSLAGFYRDLLIAKTASDRSDLVAVTATTWAAMKAFGQTVALPLLLTGQQHLRQAELQVRHTTQPRLWLEVTLLGLLPSTAQTALAAAPVAQAPVAQAPVAATPSPARPSAPAKTSPPATDSPTAKPSSLVVPASPPPTPDPTPSLATSEPTQPAPTARPPDGDLAALWQTVINAVASNATQMLLRQWGCLLKFDGKQAEIGITERWLKSTKEDRLPMIEQAFQKAQGQAIAVKFTAVSTDTIRAFQDRSSVNKPTSHSSTTSPLPTPTPQPAAEPSWQTHQGQKGLISAAPAKTPETALKTQIPTDPAPPPPDSTLPVAPAPLSWQPESDLDRAVKSFAQFFNGQVVNLDTAESSANAAADQTSPTKPQSADREVPF
ncbi:DNA polymerase III subunit gamma/tau [Almyronema epifaneia]|uniref:DNA polymerase III subunit gamma/tau n=1 Tax=Almyronema epifaneia S1 TaxID=2991925 RepID=A0ABW6IDQ1_9CYAN